jgi:uncharacterized membrane protein
MLAARWSVWVGGIALAFAGIFAVKYSIDQGLLSPAVRLAFAALFGLVLMGVGEWVRRRSGQLVSSPFQNAMIPGVLTAAGTLTLFGAIYVAHGVYNYFGPATAFILLGAVSFATLGLSLIHGQALAGLGLLASFATPMLVASTDPKPWPLFGFLTVAWISSTAASRLRLWRVVPALANAGLSFWAAAYIGSAPALNVAPPTMALLVMIAGLAFFWPGEGNLPAVIAPENGEPPAKPAVQIGPWEALILPKYIASTVIASLGILITVAILVMPEHLGAHASYWAFAALTLALGAYGTLRSYAVYPAIFSALSALAGIRILSDGATFASLNGTDSGGFRAYSDPVLVTWLAVGFGLFFAIAGLAVIWKRRLQHPEFSVLWAVVCTLVPLMLGGVTFIYFGNYTFDGRHGAYAIVLAVLYLGGAIYFHKGSEYHGRYVVIRDILLAASWAALIYALLVMTNGIWTTIGAAVLGFAYLAASERKDWPSLPWAMVLSAVFVAGRIAWEPTIVGPDHLSKTPVFNQLLAGYGIPALLLIASAWLIRNRTDDRIRNVMDALASLFSLLTVAILVRHAMNGGVLNDAVPTLGEQSIYTLLAVGASATLMALDFRRPSIVFRTGSMAIGYISMASVVIAHYFALNPYFTGEKTGSIPFFNLLFLAYLLPGIAYGATAQFARNRRPYHYVISLALTGASLAFAYVTLSVRRFWQGEGIDDWKGFKQPELYTYSVVWLVLGVALLAAGYRFRAKSIRIASAVLVLIAVLKVFLIDMGNLEGLYRVLSFIGLGAALIGIGRFYQSILSGLVRGDEKPEEPPLAG